MKKSVNIIVSIAFLISIVSISCKQTPVEKTTEVTERITWQPEDYIGNWSLYLPGGAGWLSVNEEKDYYDGSLLWYGGSVVPVSSMLFKGDTLIVTMTREVIRERDEEEKYVKSHLLTSWFEFLLLDKENMKAKAMMPAGKESSKINETRFSAKRIPEPPSPPDLGNINYGESVKLFNEMDLDGWKLINPENKNGWKVENNILINDPVQEEGKPHIHYGNIRTIDEFEDFKLQLEVNVPSGSNSGIYLRGLYEVQVLDSYGKKPDSHNMGALYSRITPSLSAEKPANTWQSFEIILCKRHLTVVLNETKIIDNQPIMGVTGGAISADEFSPGPIYLQGDHGKVMYRNILLTPIIH